MIATRKSAGVISALTVALSGAVFASGSEGFTQGPNNEARLYNVGKGVYADKFSCAACPLAGKSLDVNLAKQVLQGNPKVTLSTAEQDAVMVYLKRRFKI
jgi:hypothetical protein